MKMFSDKRVNFLLGFAAMAAAVYLTASGEYKLARMVGYGKEYAWAYPMALDVYLAAACRKGIKADIAIAGLLMGGSQIVVGLLYVHITPGEQVPWGVVIAAKVLPPIIALRCTLGMHGKKDEKSPEVLAAEEAARAAVERAAAADRARAETADRLRAERQQREADRLRADEQIREAAEARQAAEEAAKAAQLKADRAAFRAAQANTQRDGDASGRRPSAGRVEKPVTHDAQPSEPPVTHPVTHPATHTVTHPVTHGGDAPTAGDAPASDASASREERLTLAVWEVLHGASTSARAAALKHGVDVQAVQRRVRAERRQRSDGEQSPLARAGVNGTVPDLKVNQ